MEELKKITILPGINKFGEKETFEKIDINSGEAVAVVGFTGAGKSQLLYDLERLAQKDTKSNRIFLVNDKKPSKEIRFNPKRKLIASLAQNMHFSTDMSVGAFLKVHLEARGKRVDQGLIERVIKQANEITGEAISSKANLLNLSGGQSRALMISDVANISDSPIILIDEIENAGINKEKAIEILLTEGKIILIVTHDPSLALNVNKRIIIKNGGIVKVLHTTSKEHWIAHYLNWIESYSFGIRDQVRRGDEIKNIGIHCIELENKE
jgi:ABC-type lipoprotein export system ATPase subunit